MALRPWRQMFPADDFETRVHPPRDFRRQRSARFADLYARSRFHSDTTLRQRSKRYRARSPTPATAHGTTSLRKSCAFPAADRHKARNYRRISPSRAPTSLLCPFCGQPGSAWNSNAQLAGCPGALSGECAAGTRLAASPTPPRLQLAASRPAISNLCRVERGLSFARRSETAVENPHLANAGRASPQFVPQTHALVYPY